MREENKYYQLDFTLHNIEYNCVSLSTEFVILTVLPAVKIAKSTFCSVSFFFLLSRPDSKQNGDAASAALANEDCPTIDQVLSPDERSPIGRGPTRERYQQDRACFLLNTREFRATDGNVRKGTFHNRRRIYNNAHLT